VVRARWCPAGERSLGSPQQPATKPILFAGPAASSGGVLEVLDRDQHLGQRARITWSPRSVKPLIERYLQTGLAHDDVV
jgi:hypothetical protein